MGRRAAWMMIVLLATAGLPGCAHRNPDQAESGRAATAAPPANSPLAKVQVGMSVRDVEQILGPPNDENAYVTGKAFIPWYFGPDRSRRAYFYKGLGRVVFAGSGGFSATWHVNRVEYDPSEPGRAR
jgi:hypothetical protein